MITFLVVFFSLLLTFISILNSIIECVRAMISTSLNHVMEQKTNLAAIIIHPLAPRAPIRKIPDY